MAAHEELEKSVLKAGTVVHVAGIPVYLSHDTEVSSHPGNLALISEVTFTSTDGSYTKLHATGHAEGS